MKLYVLSRINATFLIVLGVWAHWWPESRSLVALIPVILGAAILVLNKGVRRKDIGVSNAVMIVTFLALVGLIVPLNGAISRADTPSIYRVGFMMLISLISLILFIKRFINYRLDK
jgi:hypothetical protein